MVAVTESFPDNAFYSISLSGTFVDARGHGYADATVFTGSSIDDDQQVCGVQFASSGLEAFEFATFSDTQCGWKSM